MGVKFQVERRPIGLDGTVFYGKEKGNGVALMSNNLGGEKKRFDVSKPLSKSNGTPLYVPMGTSPIPPLGSTSSSIIYSHMIEQQGEPWLVFSSHFSMPAAIEAAAPLASALGADNVRIVKVLSHEMKYKLK